MWTRNVLSDYIRKAIEQATFEQFDDGTWSGEIPSCIGVIAFATTYQGCKIELRSVFEAWLFVGLKLKHSLPVIANIDLNFPIEPIEEPAE